MGRCNTSITCKSIIESSTARTLAPRFWMEFAMNTAFFKVCHYFSKSLSGWCMVAESWHMNFFSILFFVYFILFFYFFYIFILVSFLSFLFLLFSLRNFSEKIYFLSSIFSFHTKLLREISNNSPNDLFGINICKTLGSC